MSKTVQDIVDDYKNGDNKVENVKSDNGFEVTFNAPTIVNDRLIFSAEITRDSGVMFNGNLKPIACVQNEDANTVKSILETIKTDTVATLNRLEANKDWYK